MLTRPLSLRGGSGVTQSGTFGWTIVQGQGPGAMQSTGRAARIKGFEQNAVSHACTRIVSDLVATIPLQAYRKDGNGDTTVLPVTHPLAQLLERPGYGVNALRFRKLTVAQYLGYGNAYWAFERSGSTVTALRAIHPEYLRFVYRDRVSQMPVAYDWIDTAGTAHQTSSPDMAHFRDLTLAEDATFGFPRVVAALLDLMTDDEASQYVRQVLSNHGAPGIVVMMDATADMGGPEGARAAEERWQEKFVNRGGRGRVAFMGGATKLEKIGFDLKELEFPALRAIAREDICAVYGVDPRMIGVQSASGKDAGMSGVQFAEARQRLYLQTGAPLMHDLAAELNETLAPEFGADVYVRFDPDKLADITENMEQTSARAVAELASGGITVEEFREITGREQDMDPTHHVMMPSTFTLRLVSEAQADAEKPTPDAPDPVAMAHAVASAKLGAGLPDGGVDDGSKTPPTEPRAILPRTITRVVPRGLVLTEAHKVALWSAFDMRATDGEAAYRAAAFHQLTVEQHAVAAAFQHAMRSTPMDLHRDSTDEPDDAVLDAILRWMTGYFALSISGDAFRGWTESFRRVIGHSVVESGSALAVQIGVSFDLENVRVQDAIQRRVNKLAGNVTETTAAEIRALIASGRSAGLGVKTIARMIDEAVFAGRNATRATLIARTEIVGALNEGEFLAAKSSNGALTTKAWLSKRDPKVRDEHADADNEGDIPISQAFSNGLMYPGDANGDAADVCNCRCTILFGSSA